MTSSYNRQGSFRCNGVFHGCCLFFFLLFIFVFSLFLFLCFSLRFSLILVAFLFGIYLRRLFPLLCVCLVLFETFVFMRVLLCQIYHSNSIELFCCYTQLAQSKCKKAQPTVILLEEVIIDTFGSSHFRLHIF